ncbi:MAG TPA: resolvase [Nitrosarchaeum sp.]
MNSKMTSISLTRPKEKTKKDNKKIARTRRQRGYHWEDTLVKRFNSAENWKAFRLGSPSVALPDVLAVNTQNSMIVTIEAKSGTSTSLPVPADQIERCQKWIKTFDIYNDRKVILAFKFLSKKRTGLGQYESRELREFYKIWDDSKEITDCVCTYEGEIFARIDGKREKLDLKEHPMPFKTKHRSSA